MPDPLTDMPATHLAMMAAVVGLIVKEAFAIVKLAVAKRNGSIGYSCKAEQVAVGQAQIFNQIATSLAMSTTAQEELLRSFREYVRDDREMHTRICEALVKLEQISRERAP